MKYRKTAQGYVCEHGKQFCCECTYGSMTEQARAEYVADLVDIMAKAKRSRVAAWHEEA
jgi:hypothetical protein